MPASLGGSGAAPAASGGGGSDWGWNPFQDVSKALSGIGGWINDHTSSPGFNPGIGSLLTFAPQAVAGLGQLAFKTGEGIGHASVSGDFSDLADTWKQAAGSYGQGLANTEADVVTAGGLAPWTQWYKKGYAKDLSHFGIDYTPQTLKDLGTKPGGQGLAGGVANDALNVAVGAGAVGKLASLGEIGEAGQAARTAEALGKADATVTPDATLEDIGKAGKAARAQAIAERAGTIAARTGGDAGEIADQITGRARFLDRLEVIHNASETAMNPLRLLRGPVGSLTRAASALDHGVPEEPPVPPEGTQGVSGAPTVQAAAEGQAPYPVDPELLKAGGVAAAEAEKTPFQEKPPAPGQVRLYNGGTGDQTLWTTDRARAESYMGDTGQLRHVDVTPEQAKELSSKENLQAARDAGNQPTAGDHYLPPETPETPKNVTTLEKLQPQIVEHPVGTTPPGAEMPPGPAGEAPPEGPTGTTLGGATTEALRRLTDPTAKEQQAYNYYSKDLPDWAKKTVEAVNNRAPWLVSSLKWFDQRIQVHDLSRVIRENERMVAKEVARVSTHPAIQQAVAAAEGLLGHMNEDANHPFDVSAAVGERVAAALSQGPLWDELENKRGVIDTLNPGSTNRILRFTQDVPPEMNTPEFRASITNIADQIRSLTSGAAQTLLSDRLGTKGLEGMGSLEPSLSAKGRARLREAQAKESEALDQRIKMEAAAEKIRQETTGKADGEFAYAKQQRDAAAKTRIAARAGDAGPFESPQAAIDWANKLDQMADERVTRAKANVAQLDETIRQQMEPFQATIATLRGKAGALLDKVAAEMEDPSLAATPHVFKPLVDAGNQMAAEVAAHPELEPILAELPKTFGQALSYAIENGFDPAYVADMKPEAIRSLIRGTAKLGSQESMGRGAEFVSGARRESRAILRTTGQADRRIEALVAGIVRATHEDRTNHVIDFVERVLAKPMPKNADGMFIRPPNWKEWDPERKRLMGITDVKTGETTVYKTGGEQPLMIPTAVARKLREYTGDFSSPFSRAMQRITDPWRALVLTLSPKFYAAHTAGHLILATVAGATHLSDWAQAWDALKKDEFGNRFSTLPHVLNQSIMQDIGGEPSLVGYKNAIEAGQQGGPGAALHRIAQTLHGAVATSDAFSRAATYFSQLRKGADEMTAMHYASDALVDYQDLSPWEQKVAKSVIPFYGFQKGILKIAMRLPLDHPLTASMFLALQRFNNQQSVDSQGRPLPSAYLNSVSAFGTNIDLKSFNPFKDATSLTTPEGLLSSLQFAVQAVVRSGLGVPAPGTKAQGVKVNAFGQTVPNVPLLPQLAAAISNAPQAKLSSDPAAFLGLKTYTDAQLDKAGQANAISTAEAALPVAQQNKAVGAGAVVQNATLQKALGSGTTGNALNPALANTPTVDPTALNQALQAQSAQAALKKAASVQAGKTSPSRRRGARKLSLHRGGGSGVKFGRSTSRHRSSRGAVRAHIAGHRARHR